MEAHISMHSQRPHATSQPSCLLCSVMHGVTGGVQTPGSAVPGTHGAIIHPFLRLFRVCHSQHCSFTLLNSSNIR